MKKKIFIVLAALCSFHSYADECEEQKFLARLDYQETQQEQEKARYNFMVDGTYDEAQEFRQILIGFKDRFRSKMTSAQKELYQMNFEKALARPNIKATLKELLNDFFSAYKPINSRYLWVCRNPKYDDKFIKGLLCVTLDLKTLEPLFTRADVMEQNAEMIFKKNPNKKGPEYIKFDFGRFANITEEEYVEKTSAPYCKQVVETGSRRSEEQQTVESSPSQKNNSSNK